ncbi:MAG: metallophosphoesterase [Oscillospiraceae bacterium]|jgi:predicted phosphodiesterase|nr:metallophosphoesterase [Oscillospiraceae bacterium]
MKKRILCVLTAVGLLAAVLAVPSGATVYNSSNTVVVNAQGCDGAVYSKPAPLLRFRQDGSFKIMQVSDLQESYISSTITKEFLYDVAAAERPDLVILTGDNIADSAMNWGTHYVSNFFVKGAINSFMDVFDEIYRDFGTRVTMVFGNHDAESAGITRAEQFAIYAAHPSFVGYASDADNGTTGKNGPHYGTHNLLVQDHNGKNAVFNLWMFDSGDYPADGIGAGYDGVQTPQIEWFEATNQAVGKLPSLAFQHIIVPEIYDFLTPAGQKDKNTFSRGFYQYAAPGYGPGNLILKDGKPVSYTRYISKTLPVGTVGQINESPCPSNYNWGQYAALNNSGNVLAMFFGHDHVNTFERQLPGTDLVNTSCCGFGSYGNIDIRGVRIINLKETDLTSYATHLVTYNDFYAGSGLRAARLSMFQLLFTPATIFDVILFKPLLWVAGLF